MDQDDVTHSAWVSLCLGLCGAFEIWGNRVHGNRMKILMAGLMVMGLVCSAKALDKAQLNERIQSLTATFAAMQRNPATRVPANELAKARAIILLDRTKGALFFGYRHGRGVALARDRSGRWSPVVFVSASGFSLGPQIGCTKDFFVVLLMSHAATEALKRSVFDFGAKLSATSYREHTGIQTTLASGTALVYAARRGFFVGAEIMEGKIAPDNRADSVYYGRPVSVDGVLFGHQVAPGAAADKLIDEITGFSRAGEIALACSRL